MRHQAVKRSWRLVFWAAILLGALGVPSLASSAAVSHGQGAPGTKEQRVNSDLTLDLGTGVRGGVVGTDVQRCINGNGGFGFLTATDQETHNLWIDASQAFGPCLAATSYQQFRVEVLAPYQGAINIELQEQSTGGPYKLLCSGGSSYHLACTQTGDKAVTITCVGVAAQRNNCVHTDSTPTIDCTPNVHLTIGQKVVDQHICTSTGKPLPKVSTSDSPLPSGLTWKRYPTDQDTHIVINGTVGSASDLRNTTLFLAAGNPNPSPVHWIVNPAPRQYLVTCDKEVQLRLGETVTNKPICKITGDPNHAHEVRTFGRPPDGLTWTLIRDADGGTIVLNGATTRIPKPGTESSMHFDSNVIDWIVSR
jgi:hypothetical protein